MDGVGADVTLPLNSIVSALNTWSESWSLMLIARARHDMPHFNDSVDRFVVPAPEKNIPINLMTHPWGQHGFDTLDDDERSRQIIGGALSFLQEHLLSGV